MLFFCPFLSTNLKFPLCAQRLLMCSNELTSTSFISPVTVTRASREGSEDPGWGGHVSDRKKSPGAIAEEELLQWRPSLFHGDSTKCDGHLQKSNLHPSSRRRAGEPGLLLIPLNPQSVRNFQSHAHNTPAWKWKSAEMPFSTAQIVNKDELQQHYSYCGLK